MKRKGGNEIDRTTSRVADGSSDDGRSTIIARSAFITVFPSAAAFPDDVGFKVVSYLTPPSLLQLGLTCRAGQSIFERADDIWRAAIEAIWKDETPQPPSSGGGYYQLYRSMRVRPAIFQQKCRKIPSPSAAALQRVVANPEALRAAWRAALGKYRIYVDIRHTTGAKVLTRVVRPFPTMLRSDANWRNASDSEDLPGMITVGEGEAEPFPLPRPPHKGWGHLNWLGYSLEGRATEIDPLVSHVCIERNGRLVYLSNECVFPRSRPFSPRWSANPYESGSFSSDAQWQHIDPDNPLNNAVIVATQMYLPVLKLPREVIAQIPDDDIDYDYGPFFFSGVCLTLLLNLKPTSAKLDEWAVSSFSFTLDVVEDEEESGHYGPWKYEGPAKYTHEMLLCYLREAVAASTRVCSDYEDLERYERLRATHEVFLGSNK